MSKPVRYTDVAACADRILELTGGHVIIGIPLGLGKPVQLLNALYRQVAARPETSLEIYTALTLARPTGKSDLEQRFLKPFTDRVYGDYEDPLYLQAARHGSLPDNISVHEFFVQPASELNNAYVQQNYISTNYTHAVRDINAKNINVLAQLVAGDPDGERLSLSCNPEISLDLLPMLEKRRARGETILTVAQLHKDLPYMTNDAEVNAELFDILLDSPECDKSLLNVPNMPVAMTEHFIGMNASAIVRDGGTLQIGIGALGDAVAASLLLRQNDNAVYQHILDATGISTNYRQEIEAMGGLDEFDVGLYGCSEMFTYGMFKLMENAVIKRSVKDMQGRSITMHGGFFLGPNAFYRSLSSLSDDERSRICMTNIGFVNQLYGNEELKRQQRIDARFINTAFTVTLMGAAVSDQLDDGRILSGVGGQYNFVAQAHELEGARSILLVRSTRNKGGETSSNVVWSYAHTTIPRHLRDIIITEYGIADLRGKTDSEVIMAMLAICDSRFQEELMATAKAQGKLPADYSIPEQYCNNYPERLKAVYDEYQQQGFFEDFPLGSDFTFIEQMLIRALSWLRINTKPLHMLNIARHSVISDSTVKHFTPHLERMGLLNPGTLKERIYRQLLLVALEATNGQDVKKH